VRGYVRHAALMGSLEQDVNLVGFCALHQAGYCHATSMYRQQMIKVASCRVTTTEGEAAVHLVRQHPARVGTIATGASAAAAVVCHAAAAGRDWDTSPSNAGASSADVASC
jgi:hypothetical protein